MFGLSIRRFETYCDCIRLIEKPKILTIVQSGLGTARLTPARGGRASVRNRTRMHPKAVAAFAERLRLMAEAHNDHDAVGAAILEGCAQHSREGRTLFLAPEVKRHFDHLLSVMLKQKDWSEKYAEKSLESRLVDLFLSLESDSDIETAIAKMTEEMDQAQPRYRAIVPISGIVLATGRSELDFGGSVSLIQFSPQLFEKVFVEPLRRVVATVTNVAPDERENVVQRQVKRLEQMQTALCVSFESATDKEKTEELIEASALPVVDFLQFCVSIFSNETWRYIIDYRGHYAQRSMRPSIVMAVDGSHISTPITATGPMGIFRLDQEKVAELRRLQVLDVARLFGPDKRNEYEDMLHLAITNFAEGERALSPRQKILSFVSSCELFFTQKSETTRAVKEGVAYVMGHNSAQRLHLIKYIEEMYDVRSSTSHAGQSPGEIAQYRLAVLNVILAMVARRHQFNSRADLDRWLDTQRYSVPGDEQIEAAPA